MIYGQINRKSKLSELFESHPEIVEVYSTVDFSFNKNPVKLFALLNYRTDAVSAFESLIDIYGLGSCIYFTTNPLDFMFLGNKIIWRKGVWYV